MSVLTATPLTAKPMTALGLVARALGEGVSGLFNPATLFASGEKGAYFDASNSATLFQDVNGTTPVTAVGDPVGLMLDQSQGTTSLADVGPELVTNGDFSNGGTDWNPGTGWTITGGEAVATATSVNINQSIGNQQGIPLLVEFDAVITGGSGLRAEVGGTQGRTISVTGRYSTIIVPSTTSGTLFIFGTNITGTIDNVSVKALPGNHATQSTSTARPVWARVPEGGRRNICIKSEGFVEDMVPNTTASVSGNTVFLPAVDDRAQYTSFVGELNETTQLTMSFLASGNGTTTFQLRDGGVSVTSGGDPEPTLTLTPTPTRYTITFDSYAYASTSPFLWIKRDTGETATEVVVTELQVERGATATAYQKVTADYDITEAGVPDKYGLLFDGVDDFMVTPSIDLTGTDAATISGAFSSSVEEFARTISHDSAAPGQLEIRVNTNQWQYPAGGSITRIPGSGTVNVKAPSYAVSRVDIPGEIIDVTNNYGGVTVLDTLGTGSFSTQALGLGATDAGGNKMNGHIFAALLIDRYITNEETTDLEATLESKAGVV